VLLLVAVVVYLTAEPGHWRRGTGVITGALLLGAMLRFVLPAQHVGLLAIRGRYWDTLYYAVFGVAILVVDLRLQN
jgi:hypothetical protein